MKSMSWVIEMSDISVKRGEREVLQIQSFNLEKNEAVAVIGPNGSGKSTFLLVASLLLKPTAGKISYLGKPIVSSNRTFFRRMTGVAFQDPLLLDRSILENLKIALKLKRPDLKDREGIADFWLRKLRIQHLANVPPHQLSGGELQRASLARVFAVQPDVVFLDEPFSAIDEFDRPSLSGDVKDLITESNVASLIVTHDVAEAVILANRLIVMSDGGIAQQGSVSEVLANPVSSEVAKLLGYSVFSVEDFTRVFSCNPPGENISKVAVPGNAIDIVLNSDGIGVIVRLEVSTNGVVALIDVGNQQFHSEIAIAEVLSSDLAKGNRVEVSVDQSRVVWLFK